MELEASVARLLSVEASVDILGDLRELDGLLGKLFGSGAGFEAFVEAAHLFGLDEKVFLTRSVECLLQELGASEAFAEAHAQSLVKAVTAENLETAKAVGSRLARLQATPADLREVLLIFLPPDSVDQAAAGILDAALQTLGLSPAAREALAGQELLLAEALQGRLDLALLRAVVAAQQLDVDLPEQHTEPAEPARRLRARPAQHGRGPFPRRGALGAFSRWGSQQAWAVYFSSTRAGTSTCREYIMFRNSNSISPMKNTCQQKCHC